MSNGNEEQKVAEALKVMVCTPDGVKMEATARHAVLPGVEGDIQVLPEHCGLVTPLRIGVMEVHHPDRVDYLAISGGSMSVDGDSLTVSAYAAELGRDIDIDRAVRAKERAEGVLSSAEEERRINLARFALFRALVRIEAHALTRKSN